jgi:serpin B
VALPYKDCTLAGYAILPKQGGAAGSDSTAAAGVLAGVQIEELLKQQHWNTLPEVSVALPKFKVSNQNSLSSCLQALGMQAAFDSGLADLSRLSRQPLYVSNVLQSVVVEVDEQGTTAAAATAVVMLRCAAVMREPPPRVVFDRPFLFMVVEETSRTPVFMGLVQNPAAA